MTNDSKLQKKMENCATDFYIACPLMYLKSIATLKLKTKSLTPTKKVYKSSDVLCDIVPRKHWDQILFTSNCSDAPINHIRSCLHLLSTPETETETSIANWYVVFVVNDVCPTKSYS